MADLYASDARGVYIPQYFAQSVKREYVNGVSDKDWGILESGPNNNFYWETWDDVLSRAKIEADGKTGFLWQDGDLWVIWGEDDPDYKALVVDEF